MLTEIGFGVLFFTLVIVGLVMLLLIAKSRLLPGGAVEISINDDPDKTITTAAGGTLLSTLASSHIFIPSACGGQGTCGVCKCVVTEGGGALLATEETHVSPKEAREGTRLTCQVKVKENMKIELPPEVFDVQRWTCRVRSNHNVATFIKELILPTKKSPFAPAAISKSSARRTNSNTRTSTSKSSTAVTGTNSMSGNTVPR